AVNGQHLGGVELLNTGGWTSYGSTEIEVALARGANTIAFSNKIVNGCSTGDVNYDYLEVVECVTEIAENALFEVGQSKWTTHVESEALYDVSFRYSLNLADTADYNLYVNGEKAVTVNFAAASEAEKTVTVKLSSGANTLELTRVSADGTKGNLQIRNLHLSRRIPWAYQAENAVLNGVTAQSNHLYYDGTGFVGGFEQVGNSVKFTANVAYSGTHTVTLRYAGVYDHDITMSLYINGQKVKQVALPPSSSWDSWNETTEEVYLRAGKNIVEYRRDEGDSGCFNIDEMIVDRFASGATTAEIGKLISGEVYVVRDKNSGMSLDIDGYSPDAGKEIHLWHYLGNNNQKWKLVDIGNGYWSFKGTYGNKRISLREETVGGVAYHTAVTADENANDLAQQWKLEKDGDYYKLINRQYDMVLTVIGDSREAGAKLCVAEDEGKDSQRFSVDGGLRLPATTVLPVQEEQNPADYAEYGSQYSLADPVIPEPYDPYTTVNDGNDRRYDAANCMLGNGARIETEHPGYYNNGFVGGMSNGDAMLTFTVYADVAGNYTLHLGYANGFGESDGQKAAVTYLNGEQVGVTSLPSTGSWRTWGSTELTLDLHEGINRIAFQNKAEAAGGQKGDVNYDYLRCCIECRNKYHFFRKQFISGWRGRRCQL
ncbi:MAG: RICIN domain-containing protein, partial [Acetatifactor sp.]|nr:RICIN domain-containing protein [Acetatifactor sp.]